MRINNPTFLNSFTRNSPENDCLNRLNTFSNLLKYDKTIEDLQNQINDLKTKITELSSSFEP